jgi:potassium efflux system protein
MRNGWRHTRALAQGLLLGWLLLVSGGPLCAHAASAPADRSAPQASPPPESAPQPEAYPLPQLARSVEETGAALRGLRADLRRREENGTIAKSLDETERTLDSLRGAAGDSNPTLHVLIDRRQSWLRLQSRIESIGKDLERRATDLDTDRTTLARLRARWTATRAALDEQHMPRSVADRVDAVLARLQGLDEPTLEAFANVLLLQDRAAGQRVQVADALDSLDRSIRSAQERNFARRGRPLWLIFAGALEGPGTFDDVRQTLRDKANAVRAYFTEDQGSLPTLFVLVAMLVALSLTARRRADKLEEGSPSRALVECRPFSSAALVALAIWIFGQFDAPRPVIEIIILALLVPLYRVLTVLLPRYLHPSVLWLLCLVLVGRLRGIVSDESWLGRLAVLALAVGGAALIVWILRNRGPWRDLRSRSRWIQSVVWIARAVVVCLVVSAVANVFGQAGLAEVLMRGSIACLFLGAVLFGGTLVVESWLGFLTAAGTPLVGSAATNEAERLRGLLSSLTRIAATAGWALTILTVFGIGTKVIGALHGLLVRQWPIGSVSVSLANVLGFGLALAVGLTTAHLLRLLLDHSVLPPLGLPRGVPAAISTSVQYVVATLGILTAVLALGIEPGRFTILVSALGVGVGFGLQNVVNNFVSGLILLYERPIQTGDTVELGTLLGTIDRIGVRSSTVRTYDGAEVIVPNATLISSEVTNWTLSDRSRRVEVRVGVAYASDLRKVQAVLERVAASHASVLSHPAPSVVLIGLGDSSIDFSVRVWTAQFDEWLRLRSELYMRIVEALAREKIEIPFPQRDVHMRS